MQWRDEEGNLGNDQITGVTAPFYVKLVRVDGVFTGYYSTDDANWVEVGSQAITLDTSGLAGLAVTAHNNGLLNVATFTDVAMANSPVAASVHYSGPTDINHVLPWVQVAFSAPVDLTTIPASISLTQNGNPVTIPPGALYALAVQGKSSLYAIGGLPAIEHGEGLYVLTVQGSAVLDSHDLVPGEGTVTTTWLIDTTPPESTVNPLPARESGAQFPVNVQGTDPEGPGGSPASGVASFDIYVSTNGHGWKFWINVPASSPSATFHGQFNTTYSFYSIAHDLAGNLEVKTPGAEATTYVGLSSIPAIMIASNGASNSANHPTVINESADLSPAPIGLVQVTADAKLPATNPSRRLLDHIDRAIDIDLGSSVRALQSIATTAVDASAVDLILAKHSEDMKPGDPA